MWYVSEPLEKQGLLYEVNMDYQERASQNY